jgi:hypothetical protein
LRVEQPSWPVSKPSSQAGQAKLKQQAKQPTEAPACKPAKSKPNQTGKPARKPERDIYLCLFVFVWCVLVLACVCCVCTHLSILNYTCVCCSIWVCVFLYVLVTAYVLLRSLVRAGISVRFPCVFLICVWMHLRDIVCSYAQLHLNILVMLINVSCSCSYISFV